MPKRDRNCVSRIAEDGIQMNAWLGDSSLTAWDLGYYGVL